MRRRFLVAIYSPDEAEGDNFTLALQRSPWAWWHHVPTMWVIVVEDDKVTCARLMEFARTAMPQSSLIITEIQDWAAFVPMPPESRQWLINYLGGVLTQSEARPRLPAPPRKG